MGKELWALAAYPNADDGRISAARQQPMHDQGLCQTRRTRQRPAGASDGPFELIDTVVWFSIGGRLTD